MWLALASPIDALGQFLLVAHMTQHLILMSVAPPLLVLGAPVVPLLRGLPRSLVRDDLAPWMNSTAFHKARKIVMHPLTGWLSMNVAFIGWHVPACYELALRSNGWHDAEHACFFLSSVLFWWFVLQPWPSRSAWSRWMVPLYLISADLVNTALSAFLAFCGRVAYPTYAAVPRIFPISALEDQSAAGAEMWVLGSLIFLTPAVLVISDLLLPKRRGPSLKEPVAREPARPMPEGFDLLRTPVAGAFLRSRYGRITLQIVSAIVMAVVIVDGLRGTPLSSMNLAGTVVWNIVRPVGLLLILLAGNLFCMACPFTLPRELARALGPARFHWPRWMRAKWPAIGLMALFFWAYEQFSLWDSPRATALILLAYVGSALLVDSIFQGANFCKYVCPIGQFNFLAATVAPFELGIRKGATCSRCSTHDCIRGNPTQRGCELQLYLPQKIGNLDCTLCMDCVKACPHDNIGITARAPTRDLVSDPFRSSLGRLSRRIDIAILVLLVSFSSLANAAYMIAPVADGMDIFEQRYPFFATTFGSILPPAMLFGVFLLAVLLFAWAFKAFSREQETRILFCRFSLAVLPLGLAMWMGHLSFHLASSASSVGPVLQHAYADLNPAPHATHHVMHSMAAMNASSLPVDMMLMPGSKGFSLLSLQIGILDVGLLLSLYAGWKISRQIASSLRARIAMLTVWAIGLCALYALCIWVFTQPMQMRGMAM